MLCFLLKDLVGNLQHTGKRAPWGGGSRALALLACTVSLVMKEGGGLQRSGRAECTADVGRSPGPEGFLNLILSVILK